MNYNFWGFRDGWAPQLPARWFVCCWLHRHISEAPPPDAAAATPVFFLSFFTCKNKLWFAFSFIHCTLHFTHTFSHTLALIAVTALLSCSFGTHARWIEWRLDWALFRLRKSHVEHKRRALYFAVLGKRSVLPRCCVRQRGEFLRNWIFAESFLSLAVGRKAHEILCVALSAATIECCRSSSSRPRWVVIFVFVFVLDFFCGCPLWAAPVNRIINWRLNRMRQSSYTSSSPINSSVCRVCTYYRM